MKLIAELCVLLVFTVGEAQISQLERIVGGNDGDIENYPYQLQLEYYDFICGATLVSYRFALTTGSCVIDKDLDVFVVRAGTTILGEGGEEYSLIEVLYHPKFNYDLNDYDAALLHLSETVVTPYAQPIDLATDDSLLYVGAPLTISGWGWNHSIHSDEYDVGFMTVLQVVQLTVVDDQACSTVYGGSYTESMFCAVDTKGYGGGFLAGDFGGPAVVNGVLTGIISFGNPCVFVRISKVEEWIQECIGDYR